MKKKMKTNQIAEYADRLIEKFGADEMLHRYMRAAESKRSYFCAAATVSRRFSPFRLDA
ncbi:hypothetical protein ACE41H_21510 [Paenibacillus enshidis]|uniref:Uncharacterized protein n=1 Tax=Paenibacillus enshidis TaxID=1458439 RepID=A0ABV5AYQ9_9BACL